MVNRPARSSRRNCWRNKISTSGSSSTTRMRRLMLVLQTRREMPRRATGDVDLYQASASVFRRSVKRPRPFPPQLARHNARPAKLEIAGMWSIQQSVQNGQFLCRRVQNTSDLLVASHADKRIERLLVHVVA